MKESENTFRDSLDGAGCAHALAAGCAPRRPLARIAKQPHDNFRCLLPVPGGNQGLPQQTLL